MNISRRILFTTFAAAFVFAGCSDDDYPALPDWSQVAPPEEIGNMKEPGKADNIVVAHRGGSTEAGSAFPDNSIASLNYAMSLGCYASECDIYWTKDNDVVVAHADSQCRINGLHPWEATLAEIRAAGKLSNGETIPSLGEYIDKVMTEGSCTRLWLDIKNITSPSTLTQYPIAACRRACEIAEEKEAKKFIEFICTGNATVMASSFTAATLAGIPIAWMSNSSGTVYGTRGYPWANLSIEYIYQNGQTIGTRTISEFKNAGIKLSVYNVDTNADIQYYSSNVIDLKAICTNYPKKLINAMKP